MLPVRRPDVKIRLGASRKLFQDILFTDCPNNGLVDVDVPTANCLFSRDFPVLLLAQVVTMDSNMFE